MELLVETVQDSFTKLFECYFDAWSLFVHVLLAGPVLPHEQDRLTIQRDIPFHLQTEYGLLQLSAEVSLADVHTQYRKLAKLYHPDAGGDHTAFLTLQQAYEHVVEYLLAPR